MSIEIIKGHFREDDLGLPRKRNAFNLANSLDEIGNFIRGKAVGVLVELKIIKRKRRTISEFRSDDVNLLADERRGEVDEFLRLYGSYRVESKIYGLPRRQVEVHGDNL